MPLQTIFGQAQVAGLPAAALSRAVPSAGMTAYVVVNATAYWFSLSEADSSTVIVQVPPWSIAQGMLGQAAQDVTLASDTSLPSVPVSVTDGSQQQVLLELARGTVAPAIVSLSVAAAADVTITSMPDVTISGGTVSLAAGTTVGISGTVTVAGSVSVTSMPNVTIAGGTVSLAAGTTVSVTGTVTVAGSVSVSSMPNVTIAGGTVSLAAGTTVGISGTVTIAGNVTISSMPAVTISGTGNTVTLQAGTSVSISGNPSVLINASGNIVNARPTKTIATSSRTGSGSVPAGSSEVITIFGPSGYNSTLMDVSAVVLAPAGATSGTHWMEILTGTGSTTFAKTQGTSDYTTQLTYGYAQWTYANQGTFPWNGTSAPASTPGQPIATTGWFLNGQTYIGTAGFVEFEYQNNTNAPQTGGRVYAVQYMQEALV